MVLDDGRHVKRCDGGVDSIAARLQRFERRERFERMLGCHHAMRTHDDGSPERAVGGGLSEHAHGGN